MHNRILYIDCLDYFTLAMGLLLKPFYCQVVFHNAIAAFRSEKAIERLRRLGIAWVSYSGLSGSLYVQTFDLNFVLDEKVLQNQLSKSRLYDDIISFFNLNAVGVKKMDTGLRNQVLACCFNEGTSSFVLIRHFYKNIGMRITYVPSSVENYLLAIELRDVRLSPCAAHCLFLQVAKIISFVLKAGVSIAYALKEKALSSGSAGHGRTADRAVTLDPSHCKVAYFPHKNLYYGSFFRKTYLYEEDPESPLYKEKVLTLFHGETDAVSKRYLKAWNIPHANVYAILDKKGFARSFVQFMLKADKARLVISLFSAVACIRNVVLLKFVFDLLKDLHILKPLNSLKVVYVHYDVLFPQTFLLACYMRAIQTVSTQERPMQHTFFGNLCYDHYLINGPAFRHELEKRHYFCEHFHVVGLPRSEYIVNAPNSKRYNRFIDLKKKYTLVACYGFPPNTEFHVGINGECGTSATSVRDFLTSLLQIADDFPRVYLIIRFKDLGTLKDHAYDDIIRRIERKENIEIDYEIRKNNSYAIAHLADILIGKQTSIMEEAFSVGKTVLFYDSEDYIKSYDYAMNHFNVVESSSQGLKERMEAILSGGKYLEQEEWFQFNRRYFSNDIESGFIKIRKYIKEVVMR